MHCGEGAARPGHGADQLARHPDDGDAAFGLTTFGRRWGLADGRIGGPLAYATYILLVNPNDQDAMVDVLFVRDTGEQFTATVKVGANSRETVDAGAVVPAHWLREAAEFSNVIAVTTPTPIGVERATYWNSTDGIRWAGGANVQATRLVARRDRSRPLERRSPPAGAVEQRRRLRRLTNMAAML